MDCIERRSVVLHCGATDDWLADWLVGLIDR